MQNKIIYCLINITKLLKKSLTITVFCLFGFSHFSYAELAWSPKPITKQQPTKAKDEHAGHSPGQHNRTREKAFYLEDNSNVSVSYIAPTLERFELTTQDKTNKYVLPKTGMDNYHALVAERQTDTEHESSLRYPYMRGKPSGHSPEEVIKYHKLPLEIVPEPMIREHWRFYSQNQHTFQILFAEKPLVDSWVVLQTSNGSILDAKTDGNGKVAFVLPDDFKNIKPGRRANQPAELKLRVAHIANNITYRTNFTAPYSVNPSHWQSNLGGLIALSFGFISGIVIMRRHNQGADKKQKNNKSSGRAS